MIPFSTPSFVNLFYYRRTLLVPRLCGLEAWIWCVCLILIPILDNPLTFSNPAYPCSFEQGHPNPPRPALSMPQALTPPYLLGVNLF